jgi:broad specificity phosphatase PhoE
MKLIAIRHGETEWNVQGREMGQLDSPLTRRGVQQAEALVRRLSPIRLDALYSSDLGRAVQTGEIIATACGLQVQIDPALRERHMGIFQGLTLAEIRERFPNELAEYQRIADSHPNVDYVIPGGESATQRLDRSVHTLTAIAIRHPGQTVAVITHGGFLMGFFEYVLGMQPGNGWRFKRHNAAYSAFEYQDGKWSLETWNDTSHLAALGASDEPPLQRLESSGAENGDASRNP